MNIGISSAESGAQEALETLAHTKAEAVTGDLQAVRKVEASQSPQTEEKSSPAPEGTGRVLDVMA